MADASAHSGRWAQLWLGTIVEIRAEAASPARLERALTAAFAAIARVHHALSGHDAASELMRVNRAAAQRTQRISPDLRAVLTCALDVASRSCGAFDPTVGARVTASGFLPASVPASANACWRDVDLSRQGVRYRRPLIVDLSGIAKGYAVDCAVRELRRHGATAGRVSAGGDLRLFGYAPEPVHVRTGGAQAVVIALAEIADAAIATSAYGDQRRRVNGRWVTSLVEPLTGLPVMSTRTVSVVAESCMIADALTKVVALRGLGARTALRQYDAAAAILSPAAGRWRCTLISREGANGLPQAA
jgi:FAD:protein FMN transferase